MKENWRNTIQLVRRVYDDGCDFEIIGIKKPYGFGYGEYGPEVECKHGKEIEKRFNEHNKIIRLLNIARSALWLIQQETSKGTLENMEATTVLHTINTELLTDNTEFNNQ